MDKHLEKVKTFMVRCGQATPSNPTVPSSEVCLLRAQMILEEALETISALGVKISCGTNPDVKFPDLELIATSPCNIIGVMDGVADLNVVSNGTAIAFGVDIVPIQDLVDDSNLDKFRGDAHPDENGKWIKPSDWEAPDIGGELARQIVEGVDRPRKCCSGRKSCGR